MSALPAMPLLTRLIEDTATRPGWARLVLLCAPAGYGKTGTVALWLGDGRDPNSNVRWIRCTPGSADMIWTSLARALAEATGASVPATESPLDALGKLAEGLSEPQTLVIDDYHHATSAANDLALAELCSAAPQLNLVVIGRRLRVLDGPLVTSRIRVRSFGPRDLAFSLEEARGMAAQLGIPDSEQLRSTIEQADGWPIALRAALDPMGLLRMEGPWAEAPPSMLDPEAARVDPLANLARFALHHLEIVGEVPRRLLLTAAQLDAIDLDHAAEFLGTEVAETRAAVHELLELGVLVAVPAGETTEFRCHRAVRAALATRSRRSLSAEQRERLFRGRAARIERSAPFTAFKLYCAVEAHSEAETLLAWHFTTITDEIEETARLLGSLPDAVLTAHPTFAAARLFLETPNPAVPASTLGYLTGLWQQGLQERLANSFESSVMHFPLLAQAMVAARMTGDVEAAARMAHELETRFVAAFHLEALPEPGTPDLSKAAETLRGSGGLPMYYRELASTALMTGDFERARRNWDRLRTYAERLSSAPWSGFPHASTRSVTDVESGHRWQLTALSEMAFTELLDGDMRRCAELLAAAYELGTRTGARAPGISWIGGEIAVAHLSYELRDESLLARAMARLEPLIDRIEPWPLLLLAETSSTRYLRGADWALSQLNARLAGIDEARRQAGRWNDYLTGYRAMLHTVIGDLTVADRVLAALPAESAIARVERARLALFSGDDVQAMLLAQQLGNAEITKRQRLDRCLITAVAAWELGRSQEAFTALGNVAGLLRDYGLPSMLWSIPFEPLREAALAARDAEACDLVGMIDEVPESARCRRYERLTEMEQRTLEAIAAHRNASQAAAALFITPGTVKKHLASVYRKLQVKGRDEAIFQATRMGLLKQTAA
ncbi:MAG: LuxR C-terminal-related transcriptional regulator [Leucobacter sp.]